MKLFYQLGLFTSAILFLTSLVLLPNIFVFFLIILSTYYFTSRLILLNSKYSGSLMKDINIKLYSSNNSSKVQYTNIGYTYTYRLVIEKPEKRLFDGKFIYNTNTREIERDDSFIYKINPWDGTESDIYRVSYDILNKITNGGISFNRELT